MFGLISFLDRALVPYLPPRIGSVPWLAKSRPYKLSPSRIFCLHCSLGASWRTQSLTQGRGELGPGLLKQNVHITQENAVFLTATKEGGRHNAFTQVCLLVAKFVKTITQKLLDQIQYNFNQGCLGPSILAAKGQEDCFSAITPERTELERSNCCHFIAPSTGYRWLGCQGQRSLFSNFFWMISEA